MGKDLREQLEVLSENVEEVEVQALKVSYFLSCSVENFLTDPGLLLKMAQMARKLYESYISVGFSHSDAMELVKSFQSGGKKPGG